MLKNSSDQDNSTRTAVGYLRVSTDSQGDSGLGLNAQRAQIKAYADSQGLEIVRFYKDTVSGGSHPDVREGLSTLVRDLKSNQVVLVAKRDRLSRDLMLSLWIEKELSKVHCSLESCDGAGNEDSPTDVLLKNLILAFGEFERSMISERTRSALHELGKKRKLGRPAFGYRYNDIGLLEQDPNTYKTLDRMKLLRSEGHNYSAIARTLESERKRSQTGKRFTPQMVRNLLLKSDETIQNQFAAA